MKKIWNSYYNYILFISLTFKHHASRVSRWFCRLFHREQAQLLLWVPSHSFSTEEEERDIQVLFYEEYFFYCLVCK